MAKFNARGIDGLALSMQEFAAIPDEVVEDILEAGGAVVVKAQKAYLDQHHHQTGTLADSIKALSKAGNVKNGWKRYVLVYPSGTHHQYTRRKVTRAYKRSRSGRTYTFGGDRKNATNNDVGFVLAYGAKRRGITGTDWMAKVNAQCAAQVAEAEKAVYDQWLQSINL